MTDWDNPPVLRIFVRNDLASMNPGKAAAQASHAANQCVFQIRKLRKKNKFIQKLLRDWENETIGGFGTVLVFAAPIQQIDDFITEHSNSEKIDASMVYDPSYPLKDGDVTHEIAIETAGFVFSRKNDVDTRDFQLMP